MRRYGLRAFVLIPTLLAASWPARGDTHTWKGGVGLWSDGTQWTNGVPAAGGDVVLARGTVTLDTASADLASFQMRGGLLIFTGLSARLSAVDIAITNGTVTHMTNSAAVTNADGSWSIDGRVYITCTNLLLKAPGRIDADARGYLCASTLNTKGYGPGGGGAGINSTAKGGGGGGHGSAGVTAGAGIGGPANGDAWNPGPGSAGGSCSKAGGAGGGMIRIEAPNGTVAVSGTITASGGDGLSGGRGGGGSGGGIYISCRVLAGTSGVIEASAGDLDGNGGPGGSGRICLLTHPDAQAVAPKPLVRISAKRSTTAYSGTYSDIGTLALTNVAFLDPAWVPHTGVIVNPGFTNWTVDSLVITSGWLRFPNGAASFPLFVSNALTLTGGSTLQLYKPELRCGSALLTNGSLLHLYSKATNHVEGEPDYGALLAATNGLVIGPTSWVYVSSAATNGGSVLLQVSNLEVAASGGINADGRGFQYGSHSGTAYSQPYGPGRGGNSAYSGGGGGYGGQGGAARNSSFRGATYGDPIQPLSCGSGGGSQSDASGRGGSGGGLIRLEVRGAVTLNGTLTANGQDAASYGGGGSGGGIFVKCRTFTGAATGKMIANGGDQINDGGGGGGGRIAVWYGPWDVGTVTPDRIIETNRPASYLGADSVLAGANTTYTTDPDAGTVRYVEVLAQARKAGCMVVVR